LGVLIAIALVVIIFVGLFGLSFNYVDYTTAENNIIIVEESNAELETEVAESIKQYITYEGEEFKTLKPDTNNTELIAFAESSPNLHSSKLIQEQINTYKENKKKIVKLKQSQVKARQTIKFWTFINLK
jgi:predicted metalloendopeptidase